MTINKSIRITLIVTLIATILSFAKFNHCRGTGWGSPDVYIHMCYSDISMNMGASKAKQNFRIKMIPIINQLKTNGFNTLQSIANYLNNNNVLLRSM